MCRHSSHHVHPVQQLASHQVAQGVGVVRQYDLGAYGKGLARCLLLGHAAWLLGRKGSLSLCGMPCVQTQKNRDGMPTAVICIGTKISLQTVQLLHLTLACSQVGQFHQIDAAVKGSNAQVDMVRE